MAWYTPLLSKLLDRLPKFHLRLRDEEPLREHGDPRGKEWSETAQGEKGEAFGQKGKTRTYYDERGEPRGEVFKKKIFPISVVSKKDQ